MHDTAKSTLKGVVPPTDNAPQKRIRVAAIVFNQASTDIRVVKEAESLAAAGYDVQIFGLGRQSRRAKTAGGVPVILVPRIRPPLGKLIVLAGVAFLCTVLLALLNGPLFGAIAIASLPVVVAMVALVPLSPGPRQKIIVSLVVGLLIAGLLFIVAGLSGLSRSAALLTNVILVAVLLGVAMVALVPLSPGPRQKIIVSLVIVGLLIAGLLFIVAQAQTLPELSTIVTDRLSGIPRSAAVLTNVILVAVLLGVAAAVRRTILNPQPVPPATLTDQAIGRGRQIALAMQTQLFVAAVEEFDPDVVHCHDLPTVNIGRELKRRRGAKFIYDSHELWAEQSLLSPVRRKLDARLERRIMRKVDGVITVNDSIAQELYSRYPSMPKPLVIRNATRPIAQPIVYDGRLHRRAGLPPDRKIVLFQGGLASGRGLETLVAAGPNFPPEWSLVFMGEGNLEQRLRKLAAQVLEKSAQPSERICFLPPVTQRYLPMWTAGASVGIIPYENVCLNNWLCSPNKLWEYPISGVPILASPFPEMSKIINEYHIGWLLDDPLTASMISEQIWSLQHAELEEAAANCREFVAADNWTIYERRLLDFYAQLSADIGKTRGDRVSTGTADSQRSRPLQNVVAHGRFAID